MSLALGMRHHPAMRFNDSRQIHRHMRTVFSSYSRVGVGVRPAGEGGEQVLLVVLGVHELGYADEPIVWLSRLDNGCQLDSRLDGLVSNVGGDIHAADLRHVHAHPHGLGAVPLEADGDEPGAHHWRSVMGRTNKHQLALARPSARNTQNTTFHAVRRRAKGINRTQMTQIENTPENLRPLWFKILVFFAQIARIRPS